MNKDMFELNWKQIRSQSTGWWSLMRDDDLLKVDKSAVKFDKYSTLLRVKYGYSTEQAKKEIGKRVTKMETDQKKLVKPV